MSGPDLFTLQAFAAEHNVIVLDPIPDGRIHRVPTVTKPHKRNGAYLFDGERFGVMSFDEGHERLLWLRGDGHDSKPDPAQAAKWLARRQQAVNERRERAGRAANVAAAMLEQAEIRSHSYLARKGFPNEAGLVVDGVQMKIGDKLRAFDDVLLVPMRSLAGDLIGLQRIYFDGERFDKRYLPGTPSQGAVFRLGPPQARETWLCEGYSTGLSVKAALTQMHINAAVLVTFSAGNLVHISGAVGGRKFVAADNDPPNLQFPVRGETGQKAAMATKLPWCMPSVSGEDFNDLHQRAGIFAVCDLIMGLRRTRAAA